MKYGETLRQRSTPEWVHYNVDYNEIKQLIKEHTTLGKGKAISVPGQGSIIGDGFERQLFGVLADQHQRIDLFVKCKSGEIERRLNHLQRQLARLQTREPPTPPNRIPARRLERYGYVEGEFLQAGEEIRSLSRFIGAQRLAFSKLLKKYKKWTGSDLLELRFNQEVVNRSGSFSKANMGPLLDHWTDILCAVRAPFQKVNVARRRVGSVANGNTGTPGSPSPLLDSSAVATRIWAAVALGSEAEFDMLLSNIPLDNAGQRAVYWVHHDQAVELQVLLLQYMRLFMSHSRSMPSISSPGCSSGDSSVDSRTNVSTAEKAEEAGTLVLIDPESSLRKYDSNNVGETGGTARRNAINAAAIVTWTSTSEAVIAVNIGTLLESNLSTPETIARLKRKHISALLDREKRFPFPTEQSSDRLAHDEKASGSRGTADIAVEAVRNWFLEHQNASPFVGICSKRTRFIGLDNNDLHGLWASLDRDVFIRKDLHTQLADDDWYAKGCREAIRFPHVVLEIRQEGQSSNDIIKILDQSHLTERVTGFSLIAHAAWLCCQPLPMSPPYWLPILNHDIRKVPEPSKPSPFSPSFATPRPLSTPTTSITEGQISSSSVAYVEESLATSVPDRLQSPPLSAFKDKRKRAYKEYPLSKSTATGNRALTPRYWSEYDHPENGSEDDAYVIYIDPMSSSKFPRQATATEVLRKIKRYLSPSRKDIDSPLLCGENSDSNDSMTSSDEATRVTTSRNYGAICPSRQAWVASKRKSRCSMRSRLRSALESQLDSHRPRLSTANPRALSSAMDLQHQHHKRSRLRLCIVGLAASIVILILIFTLAATGRDKQRGTVDAVLVFGIVANLLFTLTGAGYMLSRRDRIDVVQRVLVFVVFVGVCVADGALLAWTLI